MYPSSSGARQEFCADRLESRYLLSGGIANDFPLGIFNATASHGPGIELQASAVQADGKQLLGGVIEGEGNYSSRIHQQLVVVRLRVDGKVDSTFGARGYAHLPLNATERSVSSLAVETDGKIVVGGSDQVLRLNADGSIDASFGKKGKVAVKGAAGYLLVVEALAAQPDGKTVVLFSNGPGNEVLRLLPDGELDKSFNARRLALKNFQSDPSNQILVLPDGRVRVMSSDALAGLTAQGNVDPSFGGKGYIRKAGIEWNRWTVSDNGELFVLSRNDRGPTVVVTIQAFLSNGKVDRTFGDRGKTKIDLRDFFAFDTGVMLGATGTILVTANAYFRSVGAERLAVVRLQASGSIDTTFGDNGIRYSAPGGTLITDQLHPLPGGGGILVGGDFEQAVRFTQLDANGIQTNAYNGGPIGSLVGLGQRGAINVIQRMPGDRIVVAGSTEALDGSSDVYVARFNPDGTFDTTFANGAGWTSLHLSASASANSMDIAPDGSVVLGINSASFPIFARLNPNGLPDRSFGTKGVVAYDIHPIDSVSAVKAMANGQIVFATQNTVPYDASRLPPTFTLGRLNADGSLDSTFGNGGTVDGAGALFGSTINDIAIQQSGRIVIAGHSGDAFVAAGFKSDGSLDPHFGYKGIFRYHRRSADSDDISRILLRKDDSILALGTTNGYDGPPCLLALSRDGVLNTKLPNSQNGVVMPVTPGFREYFYGAFVKGGRILLSDGSSIIRLNPDLTPDTSFGPSGMQSVKLSNIVPSPIRGVVVLSTGRIVATEGTFFDGRGPLFSLRPDHAPTSGVRLNSTGTLLVTGTNGNDLIDIERSGEFLKINFNGSVMKLPRKGVKRIAATLYEGNDEFRVGVGVTLATVFGDGGNDTISATGLLVGGNGNDILTAVGGAPSILLGGAGEDILNIVDGFTDSVDGGSGGDLAHVDQEDRVLHVEKLMRASA